MREGLLTIALLAALAAAWKARRGANPALAVVGGLYAAALAMGAWFVRSPWLACVLLHFAAMVVSKTLALVRAPRGSVSFGRGCLFLTLSPTLDVRRAFVPDPSVRRVPGVGHMAAGLLEMFCGFQGSTIAARLGLLAASTYPASWIRAVALLLVLDGFGRTFAGLCRALGTASDDAFDRPWLASDLADFWGRRWNQFVGRALFFEVYRPWTRRLGPLAASMATFLASGLLHEVLYVLPTDGAFGHYLLFFGMQGAGVVASARIASPRLRWALMWAVLLATTPVFFGEPYASAFPLERLLR